MAENILLIILMIPLYGSIIWSYFNIFQWVPKHPLKDVKASGGCHGTGKEFTKDVSLKSSHPCDNG
ncbi:hypothetical protein [Lysinibacillus xylanilyticus]|uniref:Uncharacterized protein n=1 Tax=Lysinibacillus xylanilyticus TaxID=582475 RepID=A0A2M9Q4Z4_9BACI|nr:hypothetical protein CWD94_15445 [Lysinibacillus xylanilyticus]